MRFLIPRLLLPCLLVAAACDQSKQQLRTLAHADSLRTDSLVSIKNDLLTEVMTSTQFVNDLNTEIAKLKSYKNARLNTKLSNESDVASIKEEQAAVVGKIRDLVARLDSSEARVSSLRTRASRLAKRDSTLLGQVAQYEKTIADLRQTVEQQKAEYEATISKQTQQIASLTSKVDTITQANVALADTLNTVYYVIGTKDDLVRSGVLVEEGHKRFLVFGGRPLAPARDLDPSKFTKIDRLKDRVINFPAGDYLILTRQNPAFASPFTAEDGKMAGGLRIDSPERFWEASKFLIIVKT
jgi:hypothetical protein